MWLLQRGFGRVVTPSVTSLEVQMSHQALCYEVQQIASLGKTLVKASAEFYLRKLLQVEILLINFYEKKFGKGHLIG